MDQKQKKTLFWLCVASILYLAVFIFPNLQGAKNAEMLSVFQPDEYAQYPYVIHMLVPGATFYQSIRNFAVYLHYYYGYPFYFFSALAILPVKLILGANWTTNTPIIVMVLREAINVLPMLLAIIILVWMQTRFRSLWKSLLLFFFLASIPAVVTNNTWWHPDSLLVLFCTLTIFFLNRDDLRFGRNFYFSAIACGLAIGTKTLGALFATTYVVYLLFGLVSKKVTIWKAIWSSVLFLLVMAAAIVVSNPLLLLPIERGEIIAVFMGNLGENTKGFWVIGGGLAANWELFRSFISGTYGGWALNLAAAAFLVIGLLQRKQRLLSIILLTWAMTFLGYFLFIAATLRPHYFLPVVIPMLSILALNWFENEDKLAFWKMKLSIKNISWVSWTNILSVMMITGVAIWNMAGIVEAVKGAYAQESDSPSIQFFNQVDAEYLQKLPTDKTITFYRDWRAYVAPQANWNLVMSWDLIDYDQIKQLNPAILFLESENINYFSDASKQAIALDAAGMKSKYEFYSDAKVGTIRGYVLLEQSKFGKAFARQDIYEKYLNK